MPSCLYVVPILGGHFDRACLSASGSWHCAEFACAAAGLPTAAAYSCRGDALALAAADEKVVDPQGCDAV